MVRLQFCFLTPIRLTPFTWTAEAHVWGRTGSGTRVRLSAKASGAVHPRFHYCKGPISPRPCFLLGRPSTIESYNIERDRRVLLERAMVRVLWWRSKIELGTGSAATWLYRNGVCYE